MAIYTKTGDIGTTSLVDGTRVSKAHLRLETYGTADELNSFVGLLRAKQPEDELLCWIQNKLFDLGTYLAIEKPSLEEQWVAEEDVRTLELAIDKITPTLPTLRGFVLPGGNETIALAHVCRTITRRLERYIVNLFVEQQELKDEKQNTNDLICLKFVNRLSDFFFILARKYTENDKCEVFLWEKHKKVCL